MSATKIHHPGCPNWFKTLFVGQNYQFLSHGLTTMWREHLLGLPCLKFHSSHLHTLIITIDLKLRVEPNLTFRLVTQLPQEVHLTMVQT